MFLTSKKQKFISGFSLVEMLVVVSIFVIVTGVILANLPNFRDKSSLDLVAQEVAIQIRGAQTYAMSTLIDYSKTTDPTNFDTTVLGYAMTFNPGQQNFGLYYTDSASAANCQPTASLKEAYGISGHFNISKFCPSDLGSNNSVCFKRPNGLVWPLVTSNKAHDYTIVVQSTSDLTQKRYVNVSNNGQIYVSSPKASGGLGALVSACE